MRIITVAFLGLVALFLSGCADGGKQALDSTGPANTTASAGPAKAFIDAELAARNVPTNENLGKQMYLQGSSLIYASCNEYFDSAGNTQTTLIFTRDAVGAVGAVATAVMVLAHANSTLLSGLGIGTGAAYTGIDLYTKDYLFSAANVDAVRTLVDNALSAHNQAVLASGKSFSYDFAANQLRDEQTICTDRHIAGLAQDAIKNGHLEVSTSPDSDLTQIAQLQDQIVLRGLGLTLQTTGPLTVSEAGALWWFLRDSPSATELMTINSQLSSLPAASNPIDTTNPTFAPKAAWPFASAVNRALDGFSTPTKASFETAVTNARAGAAKAAAVAAAAAAAAAPPRPAPAPAPPPPVAFNLGSPGSVDQTTHFDVRAK